MVEPQTYDGVTQYATRYRAAREGCSITWIAYSKAVFAGFQRTVTLSHVEKVLVQPAGKLPFFNELEKLGAKADDRLPFDCMAWFAVATAVEP